MLMNMVIHDLRSPTSQIKYASDRSLENLSRVDTLGSELLLFHEEEK